MRTKTNTTASETTADILAQAERAAREKWRIKASRRNASIYAAIAETIRVFDDDEVFARALTLIVSIAIKRGGKA